MSQRPTSAGSVHDSVGRPSTASLYRPASAGSTAPTSAEGPSRPRSAQSQASPNPASAPSARRASLETEGSVARSAQGDSPSRANRPLGPRSLENTTQGSDLSRRAVEEELQQPVLTPVPNSLATPLEKQIGTAIGLKGRSRIVPRLPRDVVQCLHGQSCCWRWLARAALEQIHGSSLASMSLADGVTLMKEDGPSAAQLLTEWNVSCRIQHHTVRMLRQFALMVWSQKHAPHTINLTLQISYKPVNSAPAQNASSFLSLKQDQLARA